MIICVLFFNTLFSVSGKFYSLEDLKSGKAKVPANAKEAYLSDEDFQKHFGMPKEDFYKARPWKQKSLKQKLGLW